MKSILLKHWEVRALLDGATLLARPIDRIGNYKELVAAGNKIISSYEWANKILEEEGDTDFFINRAPYQVGDRLFGKETWNARSIDGIWWSDMVPGERMNFNWNLFYKATGDYEIPWRPSVHMPKEFSRIHLEVVSVSVTKELTEEEWVDGIGIDMETDFASLCINVQDAPYDNELEQGRAVLSVARYQWEQDYPAYPWGSWMWLYEVRSLT